MAPPMTTTDGYVMDELHVRYYWDEDTPESSYTVYDDDGESADALAQPSKGSTAEGDSRTSIPTLHQISNPVVARVRNEFSDRDWRFFWRVLDRLLGVWL